MTVSIVRMQICSAVGKRVYRLPACVGGVPVEASRSTSSEPQTHTGRPRGLLGQGDSPHQHTLPERQTHSGL